QTGINKCLAGFHIGHSAYIYAGSDGHLLEALGAGRQVELHNRTKTDGVAESMRSIVHTAQGMGHTVNKAETGAVEAVGGCHFGPDHGFYSLVVVSVHRRLTQVAENQRDCI